jgi:hypothetical protein
MEWGRADDYPFHPEAVLMRRLVSLIALLGLTSMVEQSADAQLVNGNLDVTYQQLIVDNAPPGPGSEDFFLPKPFGWINEGSRTLTGPYEDEMSSEPWAGPAPTPVTADGFPDPDWGAFFKAFSGNAQNGPATGHLYQDVAASAGQQYKLTGWAGAEPNLLVTDAQIALEFVNGAGGVIGGQVVSLLPTLFVDNGEPFDYKKYKLVATAPAGTAFVRARASMINGTPNPLGGGQAFVVDDFTLTAVPEPSTLGLGAAGLLGFAALRRRR